MDINKIFRLARKNNASDIHITVGLKPFARIHGQLVEMKSFPVVTNKELDAAVNTMVQKPQKERLIADRGLDLSYSTGKNERYRVNIHFEKGNLGLVARIIPSTIPTMEEIMIPEVLRDVTNYPSGLVIVTGPAGSGKSTTLAAFIGKINQERRANIITLEDPIEFIHTPIESIVKQRELGLDMNNFADGLRQGLREDPNVVMVGEMRDLETISTTITVAETGHLVLATLHTYNAPQAIDRIIDVFPPHQQDQVRMQFSMVLRCVIAQKLVPKAGGGRVAIREVLFNVPAVANLIRENKTEQIKNVIQTSSKDKMITFDQSLKAAQKDGLITKETAVQYCDDKKTI